MGCAGDGRFAGVADGSTYQSVAAGDKGAVIIIDLVVWPGTHQQRFTRKNWNKSACGGLTLQEKQTENELLQ
ncbi:MAG: hypothetical protein CMJ69_17800 [Planctomycetaceae bacterium]|nr:hypothetical protein [Planctomycetaceae bacterium]